MGDKFRLILGCILAGAGLGIGGALIASVYIKLPSAN